MRSITQRPFFALFGAILLFSFFNSCKKEESLEEIRSKLASKYEEMQTLSNSVACENLNDWRVDSIPDVMELYTYYPVHSSIEKNYMRLRTEYIDLRNRISKLEGPFYLDYTGPNPHFGLICDNGHAKVKTATDFSLAEAEKEADIRLENLKNYFNNEVCTDPTKWRVSTTKYKCEAVSFFTKIDFYSDKKYQNLFYQFQALSTRMVILNPNYQSCQVDYSKQPKIVECLNDKPVFKL